MKCKIISNIKHQTLPKWWTQSCMKASSEQISAVFHQYETGVRSGRIRSVVINGCNHVNINSFTNNKISLYKMHFSHFLCTNPFFKNFVQTTIFEPGFIFRCMLHEVHSSSSVDKWSNFQHFAIFHISDLFYILKISHPSSLKYDAEGWHQEGCCSDVGGWGRVQYDADVRTH